MHRICKKSSLSYRVNLRSTTDGLITRYAYVGDLVTPITDSPGNRIAYPYEAKVQKVKEEIRDPAAP